MRILKLKGIYVTIGGSLSEVFKSILFRWILSFGSRKISFPAVKSKQNDLESIVKLVKDRMIKPVTDIHNNRSLNILHNFNSSKRLCSPWIIVEYEKNF